MSGKFVWFEYMGKDISKAQGFFGELFGWGTKPVPMPGGSYTMIAVGDRTIGGYEQSSEHGGWLAHLLVADVKAAADKVKSLGGKVVKEPFKVGDFGTMAVATDPHGGAFALWQPVKAEPAPAATTGTFCWNELASKDPEASVAFYRAIGAFETDAMAMPDGTYHLLKSDGEPRAGIMKQMMPGQPHAWLPYVQVASADATAAKAVKLGANQVVPPTDIPNVGRFAIFVDPQGAPLGVLQPPR